MPVTDMRFPSLMAASMPMMLVGVVSLLAAAGSCG
jgi:hypothetical protein